MSREVLDLFDIQAAFKQARDIGVPELVRGNREVERSDDLGVPDRGTASTRTTRS